jgi:hypothetical protein
MKRVTIEQLARSLKSLGMAVVLSALGLSASAGPRLTLEWDAPNDSTVVGYRLYCIDVAGRNVTVLDVGGPTSTALTNLSAGVTYRFAVTAYDKTGAESEPSNTLDYTVPAGQMLTLLARRDNSGSVMTLFVEAVPNRQVVLQKTTDLLNWVNVTVSEIGQPISFEFYNDLAPRKEFYRSALLP